MAGELITKDGQAQWRGLLLGAGSAYKLTGLEGWLDLPDMRDGDVDFDSYHGSQPGQLLVNRRVVTMSFTISTDPAGFAAAQMALRAATAPAENPTEEPLVIQCDGVKAQVNARCVRRSIPVPRNNGSGYTQGAIQWRATNPRLYGVQEKSASAQLAVAAGGGLDFGSGGLDFGSGGLDFGAGTTGGQLFALNAGHVPTWPRFEIDGPIPGPQIIYGGRSLTFDPTWTLLAGQTMSIDTAPGHRVVEINGVSVRQRLFIAQWTALQPDENTRIQFQGGAYDAAATLRAYWRDAYQ